MAESAGLLVDEVFSEQPVRQWVLSVPYPLRFLFARRPEVMGRVLGIVYRCIATRLLRKAGLSRKTAQTRVVRRDGLVLPLTHKYSQLVSGGLREKPRQSICSTTYPCHMS